MSIGGKGLRDWLLQRATAVWLAVFIFFLIYFFLSHAPVEYQAWHDLFQKPAMKVATIVSVFALVLHAWLGLWTVITDYIHHTFSRLIIQGTVMLALFSYLVWAFIILWGL
jgi:succinate dehydrogenase / fumarate reductase, membrane anchor subunit